VLAVSESSLVRVLVIRCSWVDEHRELTRESGETVDTQRQSQTVELLHGMPCSCSSSLTTHPTKI